MAAKDIYHDAVCKMLTSADWKITHNPLQIRIGDIDLAIDLGAENLIAAEKDREKVAIEIKSFINPSGITDFHAALGQYMNYEQALEEFEPERKLYLAIPLDTYNTLFMKRFIQAALQRRQIKLFVFDPENGVIVQWQK